MHCLHEGLWKEAFVREELGQQSSRAWNPHLEGWLLHKMGPKMEKPKTEVGTRVMELTVADGKFPNHIMMLGLRGALNKIHYVAHRAWDSGTVHTKMFPSVSFKFSSLPLLSPWEWGGQSWRASVPTVPPTISHKMNSKGAKHRASGKGTVSRGLSLMGSWSQGHQALGHEMISIEQKSKHQSLKTGNIFNKYRQVLIKLLISPGPLAF